jgi:LacI family transcriptional regulator, galactose operon repressor
LSDEDVAVIARRTPVVLLAGRGDSDVAITVRVDNEQAMTSLAEHLVQQHGVTRVGFVSGSLESPDAVARATGFRRTVEAMGATIADVDFLEADWTSAGGEAAMSARLDRDEPLPEVFACANDQMAVGVIFALQERGHGVPEDIAVTGFDDITLTRYFNPPLTTIRQSGGLLGAVAVDALTSRLKGADEATTTIVLPTQLVVRASCGCSADPEEPLRELHNGAHQRISA